MIQRIQSVFLLLALVILSLIWAFPLVTFSLGDFTAQIFPFHYTMSGEQPDSFIPYLNDVMAQLVGFFAIVSSIGILIQIFLFKNRKVQMKLGKLNVVFLLVAAGFAITFAFVAGGSDEVGLPAVFSVGMGVIFPIVAIIPVFLANRAIKKDHDLVRSVDRLR